VAGQRPGLGRCATSVTVLDGLDAPWRLLENSIGAMVVTLACLGGAYVASGVVARQARR
jgi:hypothetical protein